MNHLGSSAREHRYLGDPWWKLFRNALFPGSGSRRVVARSVHPTWAELVEFMDNKMESLDLKRKRERRGGNGRIAYRIMQDVQRQMGL